MDKQELHTQSGERLTFFQLFKEKGYQIEIPIIQRDYAQGRKSTKEVRDLFIDALYNYLLENKKHRDLDFVYGSLLNKEDEKDTKFIPLDGQQRLTTLFLLHWYLANKDEETEAFNQHLVKHDKSKFSYKTRTSSTEFCDALLNNEIDLKNLLETDEDKENSLSKTIQDFGWYYSSWESDPTIQSMLVMLDAIHYKFKDSTGFYYRLISEDNPVITFQFLNLKEFQLTDDLYIKMNARGKPLTPFENFKAKFEQLIKRTTFNNAPTYKLSFNGDEKEVSVQEYFSHKIDTDWANLFWNYRNKKNVFDDKIMNLIKTKTVNHYANSSDNKTIKYLIDRDKKLNHLTFQKYMEIGGFNETFILQLIEFLDFITNGNKKVKTFLQDNFYYNENEIFEKAINDDFDNYNHRILFYAYSQYLLKWKTDEGLFDWMRIIHNLTENNIYNNEREFIRSIEGISNVLGSSKNILNHFADNLKIDGFGSLQLKEESIKAQLLKKDKWKDLILETEQHKYFKGQISFLLNFSGIEEYYNTNARQCNWSDADDSKYLKAFNNYKEKANSVFDENGLIEFKDYYWRRALLTKGDYTLAVGSNDSFLINFDRDIGWRRLLLDGGDIKNSYKRDYVKEMFDDSDFDTQDVENSLITIINTSKADDWRKNFIEIPELLDYLGPKKYIRYYSEDYIYLLTKERMNGKHSEYYSHGFYFRHIKKKDFSPFNTPYYYEVSNEEDNACAVLENWIFNNSRYQIDVHFIQSEQKYELMFFYENEFIDAEIVKILEEKGLAEHEEYYTITSSEKKIVKVLDSLCESFKEL